VAHDFNNMLTAILGFSEMLMENLEPGPMRSSRRRDQESGRTSANLTQQLLAFSRRQVLHRKC